ncbi:hypothetical protein QZH41_009237 [Actinostola sp. cb2023]|nr:hypothetical protein QZH41_009237 [Actinostola sp. cb2023]
MSKRTMTLFLFSTIVISYGNHCSSKTKDESGSSEDVEKDDISEANDGPCMIGHTTPLTRLNAVKTGHVVERDLGDKTVKVITRAMKPPVFDGKSDGSAGKFYEWDYTTTMVSSHQMRLLIGPISSFKESYYKRRFRMSGKPTARSCGHGTVSKTFYSTNHSAQNHRSTNQNAWIRHGHGTNRTVTQSYENDSIISSKHSILLISSMMHIYFHRFHKVNVTEMDDGKITLEEFKTLNTLGIDSMMYIMALSHPKHRHRYSEQTWINQRTRRRNPVINALEERILKLTGLSKELIYGSERIQVVRYTEHGHYHAHYDSETHTRTDTPCCHLISDISNLFSFKHPCRLCRYITILYYLNDVEDGGETAFPVADNATVNRTFMDNSRSEYDYYNLNENCKYSNLIVKPKKGLAIMWYNHHRDEESEWLGAMDDYSLHGGCVVHKGIKWIANNWITAPYKESANITSVWLR